MPAHLGAMPGSVSPVLLKLAGVAVALVLAVPPSPAGAHAEGMANWYTRKDNNDCQQGENNWVDPITFGAMGTLAGWENVSRYFNDYSRWDYGGSPSRQRVPSHNSCYRDSAQNANGDNNDDRDHIRLFWAHYKEFNQGGQVRKEHYTWGSPHYEEWVTCHPYGAGYTTYPGHAVPSDGFLKGKRRAKAIMVDIGFSAQQVWVGNTSPRTQCQLKDARNDGYAWVIRMGTTAS